MATFSSALTNCMIQTPWPFLLARATEDPAIACEVNTKDGPPGVTHGGHDCDCANLTPQRAFGNNETAETAGRAKPAAAGWGSYSHSGGKAMLPG